ncbi:hypothetical protein GA0070216_101615 [Micromonospora matsumotoense]|uniref:DivIVA domain-containing protein n=1 Tax=Micromonospora matsumotoense TaxID=121616 RepID=A0A1C4UML1_9ACTN|nr:hypothetical protein [Micromonospora matsumotoense]SCE72894.1 hypothetical protein GA0070216_101615 [Micromonospora matsumotoense]
MMQRSALTDGGDDVELHREPGRQVLPAVCVLAGTVLLTTGGGLLRTVAALGGVALGGAGLAATLRPFRFVIDADGLTVRRRGLRRQLRWAELALVVLDRPAVGVGGLRLLVVPVDGAVGLPPDARVDGRPATELLDLAHVRERPDEIATALARHAGDRFRDDRGTPVRSAPDFSVSLRGYSADVVDILVGHARTALDSDDPARRRAVRDELAEAMANGLPIGLRGYDVRQVDEALDALHVALTATPTDGVDA